MPNCIYCGTNIPTGVGVRCSKCSKSSSSTQGYNREFQYDPDIYGKNEERVPEIMAEAAANAWKDTGSETKEEAQRLFEENRDARKKYRWTMQDEFKGAREGRILHMNNFIQMLRECGLNCWFNEKGGMPKTLGLNVAHKGLFTKCKHKVGESHYVTYAQVPLMQEFEELFFDPYDVPLGSKRRGWRTVLLRLIEEKLLDETTAHRVFGEPATGPVSRRYRETLHSYRNNQ